MFYVVIVQGFLLMCVPLISPPLYFRCCGRTYCLNFLNCDTSFTIRYEVVCQRKPQRDAFNLCSTPHRQQHLVAIACLRGPRKLEDTRVHQCSYVVRE